MFIAACAPRKVHRVSGVPDKKICPFLIAFWEKLFVVFASFFVVVAPSGNVYQEAVSQ